MLRRAPICVLVMLLLIGSINTGSIAQSATAEESKLLSLVGQAGGQTTCVAAAGGYVFVGIGRQVKIVKDADGIFSDTATTGLLPSAVTAVEVAGDRLYAACSDGFYCFEIGELPSVSQLFAVAAVGAPRQIKAYRDCILVADGLAGIRVLDRQGKLIKTIYGDQDCLDLTIAGETLYIAAGTAGLLTADISDPSRPVSLTTTDTPGFAWNVDTDGNRAYLADGSEGVCIIDITESSFPRVIANAQTAGMALDVEASGGNVFVADAYRGVRKLVNAAGGQPADGGSFEYDRCETEGILLTGDTLYARDPGYGLIRLNSQAGPLAMTGYYGLTLPTAQNPPAFIHHGYDDYGGFIELSMLYTLGLIDARPDDNSIYAAMSRQEYVTFYRRLGVALPAPTAKTAALPVSWEGTIKDATLLAGLTPGADSRDSGKRLGLTYHLDMTKQHPSVKDVYRIAGRALMLNTPVGEQSPQAKKLASRQKFGNVQVVFDVKIRGDYAYTATDVGLAIFDIQRPEAPVLTAIYPTEGVCNYLCLDGDYAYVNNYGAYALMTFDISTPSVPKLVGYYQADVQTPDAILGTYREIVYQNNTLYLPDEFGLEIIDCSDPYNLKLVSFLRTDGLVPCGVSLSGGFAYLNCEHEGIYQIDVRDINHPQMIGQVGGDAGLGMVVFTAVADGKLLVPSSNGKLSVLSIRQNGSLRFLNAVGDQIAYNITGVNQGMICTLGNQVTAFRLSGDAAPLPLGTIDDIESFVGKGDLEDGRLALASNTGLYVVVIKDGLAGEKAPLSTAASSVSHAAGISVVMPGTTIKATRSYGSSLQQSAFAKAKHLVVTSTADSGKGSLRDCLNQCFGQNWYVVTFDPRVFSPQKPAEIMLKSPLPELYRTWIDASNAGVIVNCTEFPNRLGDTPIKLSEDCILMGMTIMNCPKLPLEAKYNNIIGGSREIGSGPLGQGNAFYSYRPIENRVLSDVRLDDNNTLKGNLFGIDILHPEKRNSLALVGAVSMKKNNLIGSTVDGEQNIFDRVDTPMYLCGIGVVNNLITGNIIGYTLDGKESGCVNEAIVLDLCIGNTVSNNKVSAIGRSVIVCTGISGGNYNVIRNNQAIDHQTSHSELGFYFLGSRNVVENNHFAGQIKLNGSNNVFSGNEVRYTGQLGALVSDDGESSGNFIGGMGPGAGNVFGEGNPPPTALSAAAAAGPYIRGNTFYCSEWFCYAGEHAKTVFCDNAVHTTPAIWNAFQADVQGFGAASGNVRK